MVVRKKLEIKRKRAESKQQHQSGSTGVTRALVYLDRLDFLVLLTFNEIEKLNELAFAINIAVHCES